MLNWLFGGKKARAEKLGIDLEGDGTFSQEIVGESFYQDAIERIAGRKEDIGKEHYCSAELICEDDNPHDRNAVAVFIENRQVGHLSKSDAKKYRALLQQQGLGKPIARADAVIVGGWKSGSDEGHFGVKLDIS